MNAVALQCDLPHWSVEMFRPHRYKVVYGGRGAARSWSFARILLIMGCQRPIRVLCARELQRSIKDSVHKLLSDQIELLQLPGYRVLQHEISHVNGTTFIFEGLKNNTTKIKSLEGLDYVWVEEAERISNDSWSILIPTVRKPGSEIWITFNPDQEDDPTYQRFVLNPPPDAWVSHVGWEDNPWFPEVLRLEKDYDYSIDPEAAEWVWGGQCRKQTEAAILRGKWVVQSFEVDKTDKKWQGPYHGADFGFANDPNACVRLWIRERKLYVEHESYVVGLDTHKIAAQWQKDMGMGIEKYVIRADSSRPETISYLRQHGIPRIERAMKWPGSVEDGIAFIRSFEEIVIHTRCKHMQQEARLYSYKVDKLTSEVLPVIVDKHNHIIDSIRYGLSILIRANRGLRSSYSGMSYSSNGR